MRRTSTGVALALALAPSFAHAAKDPKSEPLRASLEVEAEDAEGLEERVDTALGARLRKAEVLPRKTLQDGLIHVEVKPLPKGGYHYDVYAEKADTELEASVTRADCVDCDEDALLEAVGAAVDKCLPVLAAAQEQNAEPEPESAPVVAVNPQTEQPTDTRPGAGPMGKAGIGLMVAGAATAVVGVIFIVQGRSFDTRPGALEQEGVDFRPPGFVLAGAGALTLITGGILYAVDRKRRKRTELGALWVPGGVGVSVGGRF